MITAKYGEYAEAAIKMLEKKTGQNADQILRQALGTYLMLVEEEGRGNRVYIHDRDGYRLIKVT